jgi:hypothetical protein
MHRSEEVLETELQHSCRSHPAIGRPGESPLRTGEVLGLIPTALTISFAWPDSVRFTRARSHV